MVKVLNIGIENGIGDGIFLWVCRIHEKGKDGDDLYSINALKRSEEINVLVGWLGWLSE